jgi:hypothetical protein
MQLVALAGLRLMIKSGRNKMDEYIKQSIDARKNAFSAAYEINAEMQKKIDALFVKIEELGTTCKDVNEFEAKFAASPLNQQYMDLFTEIATGSVVGVSGAGVPKGKVGKMVAGSLVGGAVEGVVGSAVHRVVPTRAAVHQKAYDAARDIPVVGDAIDVSQKVGYAMHLGKLFGGRKKKKEEEEE